MPELSFWEKLTRRKLKNYLFLDKRLQFHFAFLLAAIGAINAFYFSTLVYFYTQEIYQRLLPRIPDYALDAGDFESQYRLFLMTVIFVTLFEIVLIVLLGLFFSHRIAGPLYAMRQKLKEMAKGRIPTTVRLRKNDLLQTFADEMNEVLSTLSHRRAEVETALNEINAGNHEACKRRLEKLMSTGEEPGTSSPSDELPKESSD